MASVKISELPTLSVSHANDIIVVNNGNTTYKCSASGGSFVSDTIPFAIPTGLTCTANGATVTELNANLQVYSRILAFLRFEDIATLTFTNTTNLSVALEFAPSDPSSFVPGFAQAYAPCYFNATGLYAGDFTTGVVMGNISANGHVILAKTGFNNGTINSRYLNVPANGTATFSNFLLRLPVYLTNGSVPN